MLKPNKTHTIKQFKELGVIILTLNEMPCELMANIKARLGGAIVVVVITGNTMDISISPTYDSDLVRKELEATLNEYYAPVPVEFSEAFDGVL